MARTNRVSPSEQQRRREMFRGGSKGNANETLFSSSTSDEEYGSSERKRGNPQAQIKGKELFRGGSTDEETYLENLRDVPASGKLWESHQQYIIRTIEAARIEKEQQAEGLTPSGHRDWTSMTEAPDEQKAIGVLTDEEKVNLFSDPILKKMAARYVYSGEMVDPNDPLLDDDDDDDDDDQQPIKQENPLDIHVPRITAPQPKTLQENIDIIDKKLAGVRGEAEAEETYYKAEVEKQKQAYETLSNEIKTFKIDPFRAYESTMFAVTAGLAAAFGAAAQALTGGPNTGLQMVNRAIDMDIARQKHEYETLKSAAARQNTLYGKALEMFGSSKRAVQALKTLGLDLALRKTQSDLDKYNVDQSAADSYITNVTRAKVASANALFERQSKSEMELEQGKAAMAEAAFKFHEILDGYEEIYEGKFGWLKLNSLSLLGGHYPTLALKLSGAKDGSAIKKVIDNEQSVAKLINSLSREALKAGGEGAKISDADVKLTSAEILGLMPHGRFVMFPKEDIALLRKIVTDWVEMKTGLPEAEVLRKYGRKGSRKYKRKMDEELSGMIREAKGKGLFKVLKTPFKEQEKQKEKAEWEEKRATNPGMWPPSMGGR